MNNKLTTRRAFILSSFFMVLTSKRDFTRHVMVGDVATTCQVFFSSMSYDHEVLFNKKRKFPFKSTVCLSVLI